MKILLSIVLLLLCLSTSSYCSSDKEDDIIYLKNGSIVRGEIIEIIFEESVKIRANFGGIFVFNVDEIDRISKGKTNEKLTNVSDKRVLPPKKSGWASFALSWIIPGAGQVYNDEAGKGAMIWGGIFLGGMLIINDPKENDLSQGGWENSGAPGKIGITLLLGSFLYSIIDAPISSSRINRENGHSSFSRIDISDNVYVGTKIRHNGYSSTFQLNAVLSF